MKYLIGAFIGAVISLMLLGGSIAFATTQGASGMSVVDSLVVPYKATISCLKNN